MWIHRDLALFECPKPVISGQSAVFVEAFWIWNRFGSGALEERPAKEVEALLFLDAELAREAQFDAREA